MAKSNLVKANEKIAEEVVGGYKKIEKGVVSGCKKIEDGAVEGFQKIADRFVDNFLTKDGESVEEAKARLSVEQKEREAKSAAEREEREQKQKAAVEANIKNYAQLLQMEQISKEQGREYAKGIESAAARLSSLISNILKLNKLEHQWITPEAEVYDVCRQLCESVFLFEDALEEKGIELEADIEDAAMIKADRELMGLVWSNLLSNAVKFTDRGGSITLKQTSDENRIRVSVSDTGCGIARESLNHIFDKFYQGDTSHSAEGNGLGLALVKRVLELTDADIQIISEPGKGSTFLVTLPAVPAEP